MIYRNALVFIDGHFRVCDFEVLDGKFAALGNPYLPSHEDEVDLDGHCVIPGLVDVHTHGSMNADFSDGDYEGLKSMAAYLASSGVTSFAPAGMTLPYETLAAAFATGKRLHDEAPAGCARLMGIHMEGPFFSEKKKGAQNGAYLRDPDFDAFKELYDGCGGLVRIVDVAPELPGAVDFARKASEITTVSIAHTDATYEEACAVLDAGASHLTHLYNAMPELTHREPGVVGAVMDSPHVTAELICDGNHVHPAAVRAAFRMIGADRIVLISDSLRATGLGDGIIDLGGQRVKVEGTRATLVDGGNLAGSVTNLMDCMRIAVREMGISLEDAVRCATINPARVIGADADRGSLEVGKLGDVVLLKQDDLSVRCVIKEGRVI